MMNYAHQCFDQNESQNILFASSFTNIFDTYLKELK